MFTSLECSLTVSAHAELIWTVKSNLKKGGGGAVLWSSMSDGFVDQAKVFVCHHSGDNINIISMNHLYNRCKGCTRNTDDTKTVTQSGRNESCS